jgi:hypothetical protein
MKVGLESETARRRIRNVAFTIVGALLAIVAYYDPLRAPRKELVGFEESARLVPYEEPEQFFRVLIDRVRPLAGD